MRLKCMVNNYLYISDMQSTKAKKEHECIEVLESKAEQEQNLKTITKQETEHEKTGKKKRSHRRAKYLNKLKYCKESETQLPESVNIEVK